MSSPSNCDPMPLLYRHLQLPPLIHIKELPVDVLIVRRNIRDTLTLTMEVTREMRSVPIKCRACSMFFKSDNFCAYLGNDELCQLNAHSRTLKVKRGETLDESMLKTWPILAVAEGVIGIKHILDDGRRTIAAFLMEGDIIDLRWRSEKMRGSLVALSKVAVCRLSPEVFDKILIMNPDARHNAWDNLREQTNRAMDHSADLGKKQALEKLASFIFECRQWRSSDRVRGKTVGIPIRRCDVAEYLGLQPETVSRGFRELQERKIVRFRSPSVVEIENSPRLKRIANGGQVSDGDFKRNGAGMKILSYQ